MPGTPVFADRRDAGRRLAPRLDGFVGPCTIVLALPRGGVPVAYEIALRLDVPLDVLVVRKLGVPGHSELAMGAIASGGILVVDQRIVNTLGISREAIEGVVRSERVELERRERIFHAGRARLDLAGKTVIVVDDGLATGASMAVAIDALKTRTPARIVAAVPVAATATCEALRERVDEMICLFTPGRMYAVGVWYQDFTQTTDSEVHELLDAAARERPGWPRDSAQPGAT
jgi:putative phosphoribosyl transferase